MRGQGGAWLLACGLWAPGDPQFQRSLPVACGALSRATVVIPSCSWEQNMESESKPIVKERLERPNVGQDSKDGIKAVTALDMIRRSYKWLPRVLQTRNKDTWVSGCKNLPKPRGHSSRDPGNSATCSSGSWDVVWGNKPVTKDENKSSMEVRPQLPKAGERSSKNLNKYDEPDKYDLPTVPLTSHRSSKGHEEKADLTSLVTRSSKSKVAVRHSKSDRKDQGMIGSDEKARPNKSPRQKHTEKHLPKSRKEHEKPNLEGLQTATSLPPFRKGNETASFGPYKEIDVRDRHPKCKLTFEEVKRKAERVPTCLGSRARVKYVRQIYKLGRDPDTWNWKQYDYTYLLTEPIIVIKDVPHRNCRVSLSTLESMAQILPNSESRECFIFLCFYHGLDPGETLGQIEKNPLHAHCLNPLRALEEHQNHQNPVTLKFCNKKKTFCCVEVELKASCDHLLCSARSGSQAVGCLLNARGISRDSPAVPSIAAGDISSNLLSAGGRPADLKANLPVPEDMNEETLASIPRPPPGHPQNPQADSIQGDVIPSASSPSRGASNYQASTWFSRASMMSSSEVGNQRLPPLVSPPPPPQSPALPQAPQQTRELPLTRPPPSLFPPPPPSPSPRSSEPVEMDWMELDSVGDEYRQDSYTASRNTGLSCTGNLDANHSVGQNLLEEPLVSNQDSSASNGSGIAIKGPVSRDTSSTIVQESSGTDENPICSPISVFIEPIDYPNSFLSDEQMSAIEDSILDAILETPVDENGVKPKFLQSVHSNGRFGVTCCDGFSRKWLYAYLGTHKPCPDVSLRIVSKDFRSHLSPPRPPSLPPPPLSEPKEHNCMEPESLEHEDQLKSSGTTVCIIDDLVTDPVPPNRSSTKEAPSRMYKNEPERHNIPVFIEPIDYPNAHLSDEQMTAIENNILEAMSEMDKKPKFLQSIRRNGRYGVTCSDNFSRKWLYAYLGTHRPWPNSSLRIVSKDFAEIRASAVLPLCQDEDNERILKLIGTQNDGLDVCRWEVVQRWESGGSKTCMDLVIDEESARVLDNSSRIIFKMGTGQIVTDQNKKHSPEVTRDVKKSSELDSSKDEIFPDVYDEESDKPEDFDLLEQGIYAEFFEEKTFLRNASVEDTEVHRGHERLLPNSEESVNLDHAAMDCLRTGSDKSQSDRGISPGSSSSIPVGREHCKRDKHVASRSPLSWSRQDYPSPKDDGYRSSMSSPNSTQSSRSRRSSSSQTKQGREPLSGRSHPEAYSSNPSCRPRCKSWIDECREEGTKIRLKDSNPINRTLPGSDQVTSIERNISSPISHSQLLEDVAVGADRSRDSSPVDSGGFQDPDQESSNLSFSFQYDPDRPIQDVATEQFRKLIAAGYSCQEALNVTQAFVSRQLNPAPATQPDPPKAPSPRPQLDPTLHEVAADKFSKLVAAGFSHEKALQFTQAFLRRQMGLLPHPAAFSP